MHLVDYCYLAYYEQTREVNIY